MINAKKLLADIEAGSAYYDLIEVMTCKTGCVGGAGQPYGLLPVKHQRSAGLYIQAYNYTLILDEVTDVVETVNLSQRDRETLLDKYVQMDEHGFLHWIRGFCASSRLTKGAALIGESLALP